MQILHHQQPGSVVSCVVCLLRRCSQWCLQQNDRCRYCCHHLCRHFHVSVWLCSLLVCCKVAMAYSLRKRACMGCKMEVLEKGCCGYYGKSYIIVVVACASTYNTLYSTVVPLKLCPWVFPWSTFFIPIAAMVLLVFCLFRFWCIISASQYLFYLAVWRAASNVTAW